MGIIAWIAGGLVAELRATVLRRSLRSVIYSTGRLQVGHRTARR